MDKDVTAAVTMMQREMRVRDGAVAVGLGENPVERGRYSISSDEFLMHLSGGTRMYYRKGEGVTIDRMPGEDPRDIDLFLNGSVYAAAACINGLYPMHASAVAVNGHVHAFTGPSGAGKSTLIAELGRRGFPMFCDDTMLIDMSRPDQLICLPGHKRLKLTPDALAMTGATAQEQVASMIDKRFAEPAAGVHASPLPLAGLMFLEEGDPARIEPMPGGERILRLQDDHYTTEFFEFVHRPNRAERFRQLARLAQGISISRFVRPRDSRRFADDAAIVAEHLQSASGNLP